MIKKSIFAFSIGLLMLPATAQTFDSTGSARLWAPTPPKDSAPEIIQVPGYGAFADGGVVKGFDYLEDNYGGCQRTQYIGVCTAKKGAPGYRYYQNQVCPVETLKVLIHVEGTWDTCNG